MQGKILNISGVFALIRAENQDKFEVPLSEIKSELSPRVGDDVDFDLVEGKVTSVYILRQSASIDEHLSAAKDTANHIYQKVKAGELKQWKLMNHYHQRSLSETAMYRYKQPISAKLSLRDYNGQVGEALAGVKALNKVIRLGMPVRQKIS